MENRAHAILAICFLAVFVIAAALIFWWLSAGPSEPVAYRIVTTDSVAGLAPRSAVEFKGLPVGHVTRIRFDPTNPGHVIIDFNVRQGTYVTHATYAVLTAHGLTGAEVLELKLGPGNAAPLVTSNQHPALIPLHQSLLAQLESSAQQNLQELHAILASTRELLDQTNRQHLARSLHQLDESTARLVAIEDVLLPALQRMPALAKSAQQSLNASHTLIANANRLAQAAQGPVRQMGQVEGTAQHLGHTLATQTAPDLDALSHSLAQTSRQLNELIRQLQARPQSVLFGAPKPSPGPGEPGFRTPPTQGGGHE